MSQLLELQQQLQETSALVTQLERALSAHPDSIALQLNLQSVTKRFSTLEEEFNASAERASLDVCTYRLFASEESGDGLSLRGLSSALYDFQLAFSSLFDALKNGPRLRKSFGPEVVKATAFSFGYAYSGSVGVVLTMERERLLLGTDLLDDTVTTFFSLARAPSHDDIKEIGRRLGPAPLRAIYDWARAHVEDGLGADISWRHGAEVHAKLLVQQEELERLAAAIAATSEETRESLEMVGLLTGADIQTHRFRFEPDVGEAFSGTFEDAINASHTVELPSRYRVRVDKVTVIQYSTDQKKETWRLLSLERA